MNIKDFVESFRNHPVLFIGTGLSKRYLKNSYSWEELLKKISFDLKGSNEYYLDLKSQSMTNSVYCFDKLASTLESDFEKELIKNRDGKFKYINDIWYSLMGKNIQVSRFKLYLINLLKELDYKEDKLEELNILKTVRKNIGSIITTNYDTLIEDIFNFKPLIGNNIFLSNPYGSLYKIHGCVTSPIDIIITSDDYDKFNKKYELIRAQLLSLFLHNPIIFIGYSINDQNIKNLLKTIFFYVDYKSEISEKIKDNFLLIEYENNSNNLEVIDHHIDIDDSIMIRINKVKTDKFIDIFKSLSDLHLPVSAMDIRKVQNIVYELYSGGDIKVQITDEVDGLNNSDKVLAIGTSKSINYVNLNTLEFISKYFDIIEESNFQKIKIIDTLKIQTQQFFPIFGFFDICRNLINAENLKVNQINNINKYIDKISITAKIVHNNIESILDDNNITNSNKNASIIWNLWNNNIDLKEVEKYLRGLQNTGTEYRRLLCCYDYKKYFNE